MQQFQEKTAVKRTKQRLSYEEEQKRKQAKKNKRVNKRQMLEL